MSDSIHYHTLIIGAGPAGLACAIHLKQLNPNSRIAIIEKGSRVGAQILSGAVIETDSLDKLLPKWRESEVSPTPVTHDSFLYLTKRRSFKLPLPKTLKNGKNVILSLAKLTHYLASEAENLGIEIFTGFSAKAILYNSEKQVIGVDAGATILADQTVFAEGCKGYLAEQLIKHCSISRQNPPCYGLGIKEIWQIADEQHRPGTVTHTNGWPLSSDTYGGGFIYHMSNNKIALGFIVGLDYSDPSFDPHHTFQKLKSHPRVKALLQGGKRLEYGAKTLNEGGYLSLPDQFTVPGGMLVGCSANLLNPGSFKGVNSALKSGLLAAKAIANTRKPQSTLTEFDSLLKSDPCYKQLHRSRNIRPAFRFGRWFGLLHAALVYFVLRGREPWTFKLPCDHGALQKTTKPIPRQHQTKLNDLFDANVHHDESGPSHLIVTNETESLTTCSDYHFPETAYCPAGVYSIIKSDSEVKRKVQFSNCLHCKCCEIKDPSQTIKWTPPNQGDGPNYNEM